MLEDGIIYGGSERGLTDGWVDCLLSFLFFSLLLAISCMCRCQGPAGVARLGEYKF